MQHKLIVPTSRMGEDFRVTVPNEGFVGEVELALIDSKTGEVKEKVHCSNSNLKMAIDFLGFHLDQEARNGK